jgi:hypothetical protein
MFLKVPREILLAAYSREAQEQAPKSIRVITMFKTRMQIEQKPKVLAPT